jgi:secreted PhoX family phosphatase
MINRRHFMQAIAVAAATPASVTARERADGDFGFGKLKRDPGEVLDLPEGFSYRIIARRGEEMDDGLLVPAWPDGMAAFPADDNTIRIVCNHECGPAFAQSGAFGPELERFEQVDRRRVYDTGNNATPGNGGTTTIHYDPVHGERISMHLSLAGTEVNCAGGGMPWGSWLSCEESFSDPGTSFERGRVVQRERNHGYVFEVPSSADGLVEPVPLTAMGRFEHEAAAADPSTGIIYMTEDRHRSLFYRFIPDVPGQLREGGRLQALAIADQPSFDTRNWLEPKVQPGAPLNTTWIDLEEPDVERNDLRLRGHEMGAAIFARGEGLCYANGDIAFTCTIGGPSRLGQVYTYRPSSAEGTPGESSSPGQLTLLAESRPDSILRNGDNLTMSPWGDLLVCEDTADHCGVVGVRADGRMYPVADNAYTRAELAGICFAPDGKTMFLNIQQNGMTLAITGPWAA